MQLFSSLLEVAGVCVLVVAVFVLAGIGWGLVASGAALVAVGVLLDPPRRRVGRDE